MHSYITSSLLPKIIGEKRRFLNSSYFQLRICMRSKQSCGLLCSPPELVGCLDTKKESCYLPQFSGFPLAPLIIQTSLQRGHRTSACKHTQTNTHTHTHARTHARTHTHTHTHREVRKASEKTSAKQQTCARESLIFNSK